MATICQSNSVTIGLSDVTICGILFKIYDIKPTSSNTIDVITGTEFFQVSTGSNGYTRNTEFWSFKLISKNISANTAVINFTNSDNPCYNITCSDTCIGNDLYTQYCSITKDSNNIPTGYTCKPYIIKTPNDPSCMTTGSINCTSTPSGAQIWLDGINTGQITPYTLTNIPTGIHTVTYKLTGYNDCVNGISVTSGQTTNVPCTLVLSTTPSDYELYFKVPEIYPMWYINSVLQPIANTIAKLSAQSVPVNEYYFESLSFDSNSYIITVTMKKTLTIGGKVNTMFVFLAWLPLIAMIAISAIVAFLFGSKEAGTKKLNESPTIRKVTIYFKYCTDADNCKPTAPSDAAVTIKPFIKDYTPVVTPTGANSYTLDIPANYASIDVNFKTSKDNYANPELNSKILSDTTELTVIFFAKQMSTVAETPVTTSCPNMNYAIIQSGITLKTGKLENCGLPDVNGKYNCKIPVCGSTIECKLAPNVPYTNVLYPDDADKAKCPLFSTEVIPEPGPYVPPPIIIPECGIIKNTLNVYFNYTKTDGTIMPLKPDSIKLNGTDHTFTYNDKNKYSILNGLDKNVTYTVNITKSNNTVLDNDQTIQYTTDCGYDNRTFEAQAPLNTYDITINVMKKGTIEIIRNAKVKIGLETVVTNTIGNAVFTGLQADTYLVNVTHDAFKPVNQNIILTATGVKTFLIEMEISNPLLGVLGTITHVINRATLPGDDDEITVTIPFTNPSISTLGYRAELYGEIDAYTNAILTGPLLSCESVVTDGSGSVVLSTDNNPMWSFKSLGKSYKVKLFTCTGFGDKGQFIESKTITFTNSELNPCCLSLPLIGCIASGKTCETLKTVAYISGGLIIGYLGYKLYKSLSPTEQVKKQVKKVISKNK